MRSNEINRIQKNPRHPVDFVDFVDIFRKSLKLLDFLRLHGVDISWIFSWPWIYPWIGFLRTRTEVFPKRKLLVNPEPSSMAFQPFDEKKNIDFTGYAC